jgi:uncharacterized membrane protein
MDKFKSFLKQFPYQKAFQFFIQGLIVVAPIGITIYVIFELISTLDNWLPPIFGTGSNYGVGFIIIIASVVLIGYLSNFFLRTRLYAFFDKWMEKTPGIKFLYSTTKDFFGAFAGNKKKFNEPVLVCVDGDDVWRIGFITQPDAKDFGLENHVAVYVPMSYSIAGQVYFVSLNKVKKIQNVEAGDAMKFAISGGVTEVDEEIEITNEK